MTLEQKIMDLTAEDGPNIPLRTLAIYCGTTHSTLGRFARGEYRISDKLRAQIEKGMQELAQEILSIVQEDKK